MWLVSIIRLHSAAQLAGPSEEKTLHRSFGSVAHWALSCGALVLLGCSGRGYSLESVSGTVTIDGKPLANATVTFVPLGSGVGPASVAVTDDNGDYTLRTIDLDDAGAVPGTHRVTVTTARAAKDDERAPVSREVVPPKYRDGSFQLKVDAEGTDAADIDMKTPNRRRRSRR